MMPVYNPKHGQVTVTSSATALPASAKSERKMMILKNQGLVTVTLTNSTGADSGIDLEPGEWSPPLPIAEGVTLYAKTASGSSTIGVMEW